MIQGTTSDAGKSIMVAALCRIFKHHNISVAPFKPQNMALNSAVTADGGEIGRAQAVQAQAAGIEPHTDMNPVLLKPNSDTGAQVIVHGQAIANMEADFYHQHKPMLLDAVLESYGRLQSQYQWVVVEGAGSPAEINLRDRDIANMGFAEAANCPVIIVADIDRGGVFAHLLGTMNCLSESEQNRVIGFIINRFRGDPNLLTSGLEWLEEKTSKPVLGVIPYIENLHIEAEDAIQQKSKKQENLALKVAVIALPRISNHTDFDALSLHPQVDLNFVKSPDMLNNVDVIILPGSKSVRSDYNWLQQQGWIPVIQKHLRYGGKLVGICGGLQMLGHAIHDPNGIESEAGSTMTLGYLDFETHLQTQKQLRNVHGIWNEFNSTFTGYEIHSGVSTGPAIQQGAFSIEHHTKNYSDGFFSDDNLILGTYIHGLINSPALLESFLKWCGVSDTVKYDYQQYQENEINRLAKVVESHLDWQVILKGH
ncbi:cobyric acid synthase [Bermanella sp. R86510]|uniref:cobyric acid synthase n=1 Tax=unclassified Bermanella TaxID=2627862 RepID=UPI0037C8F60C